MKRKHSQDDLFMTGLTKPYCDTLSAMYPISDRVHPMTLRMIKKRNLKVNQVVSLQMMGQYKIIKIIEIEFQYCTKDVRDALSGCSKNMPDVRGTVWNPKFDALLFLQQVKPKRNVLPEADDDIVIIDKPNNDVAEEMGMPSVIGWSGWVGGEGFVKI